MSISPPPVDPEAVDDDGYYNPGRDLQERYPAWDIVKERLHVPEMLYWRDRSIRINTRQSAAARRCALAHAIAHLDLRHYKSVGGRCDKRDDAEADQLAAERLIPYPMLIAAWRWSSDPLEVAAELDVDPAMLTRRINTLEPRQRQQLQQGALGEGPQHPTPQDVIGQYSRHHDPGPAGNDGDGSDQELEELEAALGDFHMCRGPGQPAFSEQERKDWIRAHGRTMLRLLEEAAAQRDEAAAIHQAQQNKRRRRRRTQPPQTRAPQPDNGDRTSATCPTAGPAAGEPGGR